YARAGVSLGSGALLICDHDTCVVDLAKVLLNFFRNESCGKCTPCRVGTQRAHQILASIADARATSRDLEDLQTLSDNLSKLSHCGLGQTAGVPIRDIFRHFRAEVEAHVQLQVCPTGVCSMSSRLERVA
ncbi:MAG: NADP oxidoreductase, partial [Anaerolineales bacterium]